MGEERRGEGASGEGREYSHVGIVWGTSRVNADAVGIGVEMIICANVNVTCKFSPAISLSLAKDYPSEE